MKFILCFIMIQEHLVKIDRVNRIENFGGFNVTLALFSLYLQHK